MDDAPQIPQVGDVVQLKSGGPQMVVTHAGKGNPSGMVSVMFANERGFHFMQAPVATLAPMERRYPVKWPPRTSVLDCSLKV